MRIIYFILAFIFTISSGINLHAQSRNCSATEYLEHQMSKYPDRVAKMRVIEQHTQRFVEEGSANRAVTVTIPVVVHVVYRTSAENISDAQIQSQIRILNEDFRRMNSDADGTWSQAADAEIEFCLATVDPNGNATTGITRTSTTVNGFGTDDRVKYSSQGGKDAWPRANYLNFWVCNIGGGILGYAQFPGGPAATDGVVNGYQYTGDIGTAQAPFNLGRTATHEVGHWLNLRHIWGDGGCGVDDFVSDTPESDASNGGCNVGHTSCGTVDMVQNYMDYSDDACMNLFTEGQKTRMQALFAPGGFRASLLNSAGCNGGGGNEPTCTDGIQNGDETGVDCGGICDACPTCDDGIQNGDETGVDCGGSCNACPSNCTENDVIVSITLDQYGSETTWVITNANGATVANGGPYQNNTPGVEETETLCLPDGCYNFSINDTYGDGICCAYGQGSYEVSDASGTLVSGGEFTNNDTQAFCVGGVVGATCDDNIQNGNETGVDCGGDCAPCATCDDGVQNGDETGVDCGGPDCEPCATCDDDIQNGDETGIDCGGQNCPACPTCDDGIQNGDEEGVDCGGQDCEPCASCNDGIQNGNETGIDCGGDCEPCQVEPSCTDGIQNGQETGVDCGGPDCEPCNTGTCTDVTLTLVLDRYGSETAWNITSANSNVLASGSGYPNNQNGLTITEVVCLEDGCYDFNISDTYGDGICCAYGQGSYTVTDANGNVLASGGQFNNNDTAPFCIGDNTPTPTCTDGIQNGDEEGVDCGGSNCEPCEVEPTCDDGIQNGNEEGIDCGGQFCEPCQSCTDGIQNGQETGVDCGGPDCEPCNTGTCTDVTLTLVLDRYGSETAWNITSANGNVLASGSGYPNNQNGLTITEVVCLEEGCYDFNISDTYGDGICCAYGQGSYTVTDDNGNVLASGGQFNNNDTAPFCIGGNTPTPTCTDGIQNGDEEGVDCGGSNCEPCQAEPSCTDGIQNGQETGVDCGGPNCEPCNTGGCVDITLTLQLDDYGSETAWNITNSNGDIIGSGDGYSNTQGGGQAIVASGCIDPGCYTFTITDTYGDGICCQYGEGYYEIVDATGNVLIEGGEFGQYESVQFCVGNNFGSGRMALDETEDVNEAWEVTNMYPNPVKDQLNIDYSASEGGTVQVTVFDVLGRVLIQTEQNFLAGKNHMQLDVNQLEAGYHLVRIQKGDTQFTQKFVKN